MSEHIASLCQIGDKLSQNSIILDESEMTVGRNPFATDIISSKISKILSQRHALFKRRCNGTWTVTDQNSPDGIVVNNKKLYPERPVVLQHGDIIRLGDIRKDPSLHSYFFNSNTLNNDYLFTDVFMKSEKDIVAVEYSVPKRQKCFNERYYSYTIWKRQRVNEKEEEVEQYKKQLEIKERKIAYREKQMSDKEKAMSEKKKKMTEKEKEMTEKEKELTEKGNVQNIMKIKLEVEQDLLYTDREFFNKRVQTKVKIEKDILQQDLAIKFEEKNKEIEKLSADKYMLEKIINMKDLEQKLIKDQLEATIANNVHQQEEINQTLENMSINLIELMERELQCSICSELFVQATTLNCSHSFCFTCIDEWMKHKKECPICRTAVKNSNRSIVLDNYIDKMVGLMDSEMISRRKELVTKKK